MIDPADTAQALPQVVWVFLKGGDAQGHSAAQVLGPRRGPHVPVLQKGKQALQEQVEGQEGSIQAK